MDRAARIQTKRYRRVVTQGLGAPPTGDAVAAKGSEAVVAVEHLRVGVVAVRGVPVRTMGTPTVTEIVSLEGVTRRAGAADRAVLAARVPQTLAKRPTNALKVARQRKPSKRSHKTRPAPEADTEFLFMSTDPVRSPLQAAQPYLLSSNTASASICAVWGNISTARSERSR